VIYSVYDHTARRWNQYQGTGAVPPTAFFRDSKSGEAPERLLAQLPPDAVLMGVSDKPRGVVATDRRSGALAGLGQSPDSNLPSSALAWLGLAVVVGGVFWLGRRSVSAEAAVRSKAKGLFS